LSGYDVFLFPWANLLTYPRRMSVILNKKRGSQKAIMYIIKHIVNSIDFPPRLQSENTSVTHVVQWIRNTTNIVLAVSCFIKINIIYTHYPFNISNCLYFTQKLLGTYLIIINDGILLLSIEFLHNRNIVLRAILKRVINSNRVK